MRFDVEWLEAPGVRDRVLAATWARLHVSVDGRDVTELVHLASDTRRVGVYGPVFPIAEWLVENWWHLLYEPAPMARPGPGRDAPAWKMPWVQRHDLLAAREGTALPDATFARDADAIVLSWFPDAAGSRQARVRFVGEGRVRVDVETFRRAAATLVDGTLARIRALVGDNEDSDRLAAAWQAIVTADEQETDLCRSLAMLGLDPYDVEDATDARVSLLRRLTTSLPERLRDDLLEAGDADGLESASHWIERHRDQLVMGDAPSKQPTLPLRWSPSAHRTGYELARRARSDMMGLDPNQPIDDLEDLLATRMGWEREPVRAADRVVSFDGLVGLSATDQRPVLIDAGERTGWARRFLLARSAFFPVTGTLRQGRLLTRAVTRPQRAARAFAAELLAPASALAERAQGVISEDQLRELAEDFRVNPLLIQHQLENHGLGTVAA